MQILLDPLGKIVGRLKLFRGESAQLIKRLFEDNFRRYLPRYAIAFIFMVVTAAATAGTAWMMKFVVNDIFIDRKTAMLLPIAGAVMGLFITKGFAAYLQEVWMGRLGNRIVADLQRTLYDKVMQLGVGYFTANHSSDLITRLTRGAASAREVLNMLVLSVGRDLLTLIALIGVMVIQAPLFFLVSMLGAPVVLIALSRLSKRVKNVAMVEFDLNRQLTQTLQETVLGARIIRAFGLRKAMTARLDENVSAIESRANKMNNLKARSSPILEALAGISIGLVILVAGWLVLERGHTPGQFMAFTTAFLLAYDPARRLSKLHLTIESHLANVRRMYEVLDMPEASTETDAPALAAAGNDIALRGVSFAYASDTPVLRDLSVTFPAGARSALVGPSGSGKSTILALIQRFYDVDDGVISVGGVDIRTVSAASLRERIGFVSQDVYLFAGTVRDNIRIGRLSASDAEVEAAARAAFAHDFIIELTNGYDSEVGENGVQLSGGQRQRISIARALLKDAPILLLDEATSALDSESEQKVQLAIDRLTEGRTVIAIAHRLSTIIKSDRIFVLDEGRLVAEGAHADLLRGGGLYERLCRQQFGEAPPAQLAAGS